MNDIYDNEEWPVGMDHVLTEVQYLYAKFKYICKQMIDIHEILCEHHDAGGQSTLMLSAHLFIHNCLLRFQVCAHVSVYVCVCVPDSFWSGGPNVGRA
jgi:hypothetical protein